MKRKIFSLLGAVALFFSVNAQEKCLTVTPWNEPEVIAKSTPAELEAMEANYYKQLADYQKIAKLNQGKKAELLRIPMVVHVIHNYGPENVTDQAINQLVNILNDDFNARYPNKSDVYDEFQDILGNTEVEFRLAKKGPNGECVSGINRVAVDDPYFSNFSDGQNRIENIKRQINWNTAKYMNIYIVGSIASAGGGGVIAGYATFPRSTPFDTDGFVTIYNGLGEHGGTSSHEIGHYLGLQHTFVGTVESANNCGLSDGVDDTPTTIGYYSTCPSKANSVSCGSLDNMRNIMDYGRCAVNFTLGQSAVMRGVLQNQRSGLTTAQNLIDTGSDYDLEDTPQFLCTADFGARVDQPFCPGSEIDFEEITTHNAVSFNWVFEGGTPETSTERDPKVLYNDAGMFDVSLTVSDGDTTITVLKEDFVTIQDNNLLGDLLGEGFEDIDLSTTQKLVIDNKDGDRTFEVTETAGFNSSSSLYLRNRLVVRDREDDILTNTMDISQLSDAIVSFDYAFAKKSSTSEDRLEVFVSSDCGITWTRRKLLRADASTGSTSSLVTAPDQSSGDFIPTQDQWKNYTVSVNSFKSEGFRVRLAWTAGGGNNIYIDNLFVGSAASVGVNESARDNMVKLYPNPNNGSLNIESEAGIITHVEVVNVYGAVVFNEDFNAEKVSVNLGEVKAGIYFARVSNASGNTNNMKFIVE